MSLGVSRFWERNKDRCSLVAAVVLSFLLMALDRSPPVVFIRNGLASGVGVVRRGVSWIPRLLVVHQENQRLWMEVGRLSLERDQYREALMENRRLRRLVGFKERKTFDFVPAEVIGRGTVGMEGSVHLNVGREEGCRKNMVLVTDRGLVGKLVSVGQSTSVGQLLTDSNFRVSVKVQQSRVLGIVRWLYGNVCILEGVTPISDVRVGSLVVTSGYSQIYPPGLAIGRVFEVSLDREGLFQKILLWTEVDFGTLEGLLVLKNNSSP